MNYKYCISVLTVLIICTGFIKAENKITIESMPPVVVKTNPQAGELNVDPSLEKISVTFSKEMKTKRQWSIVQLSKETTPKLTGKIRFLSDKRTCEISVILAPGKTYCLWFNKGKFNYFKDTNNNSSIPYLLVFQTRK